MKIIIFNINSLINYIDVEKATYTFFGMFKNIWAFLREILTLGFAEGLTPGFVEGLACEQQWRCAAAQFGLLMLALRKV